MKLPSYLLEVVTEQDLLTNIEDAIGTTIEGFEIQSDPKEGAAIAVKADPELTQLLEELEDSYTTTGEGSPRYTNHLAAEKVREIIGNARRMLRKQAKDVLVRDERMLDFVLHELFKNPQLRETQAFAKGHIASTLFADKEHGWCIVTDMMNADTPFTSKTFHIGRRTVLHGRMILAVDHTERAKGYKHDSILIPTLTGPI